MIWKVLEKKIVYINNKKSLAQKWVREHKKSMCEYELVEVENGERRTNKKR